MLFDQLRRCGAVEGFHERLGAEHAAFCARAGSTLLVSFENAQDIAAETFDDDMPHYYDMAKDRGWSYLGIVSNGQTFFRAPEVFAFFDRLTDDGFFDKFDFVLFTGVGIGAYAACAYSVAAPGARVLAFNPVATVDPDFAGWDTRFRDHRRRDFTSRYGYAPEMLEAAMDAYIVYDPVSTADAMHAAQFSAPCVTRLKCRHMGASTISILRELDIEGDLLERAATGHLTPLSFAELLRSRRDNAVYLISLLKAAQRRGGSALIEMLCRNTVARVDPAPRKFRNTLARMQSALSEPDGFRPPA